MTKGLTRGMSATALVAMLALAGCGDSGGGDGDAVFDGGAGGGAGDPQGIDTLGPKFVAAFRQDRNAEPLPCEPSDLTVTPRIEPFLI